MSLLGAFGSFFSSSNAGNSAADKYVYHQQGGCGVRVYPNGEDGREPLDLFFEIQSCDVDRSTTDVGGNFTITLNASDAWDELIQPDDFVRIFMGDRIGSLAQDGFIAYNFASGNLGLSVNSAGVEGKKAALDSGSIFIPIPGLGPIPGVGGYSMLDGRPINVLVMHERFIGKVDRVERSDQAGSKDQGYRTTYTVSGRSMGSIIQDISLYYNSFLAPLNAISIFYGKGVELEGSPTTLLRQILSIVLTTVPFPQWKLPKSLVKDMDFKNVKDNNLKLVKEILQNFSVNIKAVQDNKETHAKLDTVALSKLEQLLAKSGTISDQSPLASISLDSLQETYGGNFDRNFMSSTTTGLRDMLLSLQNPVWNEFFFDLCPEGDVEGGRNGVEGIPVPSFVMRQRPFTITDKMLENVAPYIATYSSKLLQYPGSDDMSALGSDYFKLLEGGNSVQINGPLSSSKLENSSGNIQNFVDASDAVTPNLLDYQVGISSHDRQNAWLVLPQTASGNENGRLQVAAKGGFLIDVDSCEFFGFRIQEVSTAYVCPIAGKNQPKDPTSYAVEFSKTLANWYFMNPKFLNGRIVSRFLSAARLGIVCQYFETRITPKNPYPKMELFYVQGVSDRFEVGQPVTTTLTVIRGIRYKMSGKTSEAVASNATLQGVASTIGVIA
jgi:hypothetical protein